MKAKNAFFKTNQRIVLAFILLILFFFSVVSPAIASNTLPAPWTQNTKLIASDHAWGDELGWSVAIDGNTAVVGSHKNGNSPTYTDRGAAYVFVYSGGTWTEQAKLTASDWAKYDEFGTSVAISGDTVVVGAVGNNTVYVFTRSGGVWTEAAKLTASTGSSSDNFGSSVSIDGDVIVAGAPNAANYASWGTGRAFVFVKPGGGWSTQTESALLEADYGTNSWFHNGDEFGRSVAISGDTIIVGAPEVDLNGSNSGLVYIFEKPIGGWTGTLNDDANIYPKVPNSTDVYVHFGFSVDIDGETIATGAYGDTLNNGRAYLFEKGSGWTTGAGNRVAELSASDITLLDEFGYAVSVDGNAAAVGSPWDDDNSESNSGSVYLFEKPDGGWGNMTQTEKVTASDGVADDYLGRSLAISGFTVVAGAPFHDLSSFGSEGAAYIFKSPPSIIINEVDADTPGSDTAEFIELYDGGVGNTSLDELVLVFYNGGDDQSYRSIDLDGNATDVNGYFVIGNSAVPNVDLTFANGALQNGADAVALYMADGADFPNGTPLTTTDLIDAIVYDTDDADDAGLLPLLDAGQPQINENGGGDKDNESNQRCPNGSGGKRKTSTYGQYTPTPGETNCPPEIDLQRPAGTSITDGGTDAQGDKKSGEQVTLTYTVENSGASTLSISNITATNASNTGVGTITPTNFTVTSGGIATFDVPYTPSAGSGAFSFELDIINDDPDESNYDLTISGTRDGAPPFVTAIDRADSNPTKATSVDFTVTFSEAVSDIETGDFVLATTGTANGTINSVSASSGTTVTATVNNVSGDGTLGLNFDYNALDSVSDSVGNTANADFTGETYTVDNTAPTVTINQGATQNDPTNTSPIVFDVVFSEDVTGFDNTDVTISGMAAAPTITVASTQAIRIPSRSAAWQMAKRSQRKFRRTPHKTR
ncbi:MAG: hypothetical protein GXP40_11590 [Chloroflexi bacterium]|nr:hypothetical protein [Chloroflexota bacterium]